MGYDKENLLGVLESFPEQCKEAVKLAKGVKIKGKFENVCVCGMGGSGIGGDLLKPIAKNMLVFAHHDYGLPKHVGKKSLVICVSYSGNTEETLSAFDEAKRRKAKIIAITSGGKLSKKAKDVIMIPSRIQPRAALGYLFLSVIFVLSNNKLIPSQNAALNEALRLLNPKKMGKEGFMLAKKLRDKIPVFYASTELGAVAYRMKTQINENAKQPAYHHVFPEMNHNELNGFFHLGKKVATVFVVDKKASPHINRRMAVAKKVLKEKTNIAEIHARGKSLLARMLSAIYVGDFTSYYLALMNKQDPTPVPIIEEFKKML